MTEIARRLGPEEAIGPMTRPPGQPGSTRREMEFYVHAETQERYRKRAVVHGRGTPYEFYCDEGAGLGGDDSAPPPLLYFSASIAF